MKQPTLKEEDQALWTRLVLMGLWLAGLLMIAIGCEARSSEAVEEEIDERRARCMA